MRKSLLLLGIMLIALLVAVGCRGQATETPAPQAGLPVTPAASYQRISTEQLAQRLAAKDFTLINVHIPYDGEIPQTDLLIPYNEIAKRASELPGKEAAIVVYCRSGPMSAEAARMLVSLGYTQVFDLTGGLNGWEAKGYSVVRR